MHILTEGLAWDWVNEKLYWSDNCQDEIEVFDPVTLHRRRLTSTGTNPYAVIVDPSTQYVHMQVLIVKCFVIVSAKHKCNAF